MQTSIKGNKIGFSKSFDEATPDVIEQAGKQGWEVEVNGGEQTVYFSKEVNKK